MITTLEAPEAALTMIKEFRNLQLGDKPVTAPYFMNTKKLRGGLRVLIGKGDPGEITREVLVWAQLKGLDLKSMSAADIRALMIARNIGIDCSGFVVHVVNAWLRSEGKQKLQHYLHFRNNSLISRLKRWFRPVENMGANLLTNPDNCDIITELNEIKPGDFIRSKGRQKNSHHILLVTKVVKEDDVLKEFFYVHSTRYYDDANGVRESSVTITDPAAELKDQQWHEQENGKNWTLEGLLNDYSDNGIRRLKLVELNSQQIK